MTSAMPLQPPVAIQRSLGSYVSRPKLLQTMSSKLCSFALAALVLVVAMFSAEARLREGDCEGEKDGALSLRTTPALYACPVPLQRTKQENAVACRSPRAERTVVLRCCAVMSLHLCFC